jgi:putative ABC transport system permease protein
MNLFAVSLRTLRVRLLSSCLTGLAIAVGTALLAALWLLLDEAERRYTSNVRGFGVVVGPREGSALDLVLGTVFNFTELAPPAGLLPLSVYTELHDGPLRRRFAVKYAIPQARGDSYRGFPVIGTTDEMFTEFDRGGGRSAADGQPKAQPLVFAAGGPWAFSHGDLLAFAAEHAARQAHSR